MLRRRSRRTAAVLLAVLTTSACKDVLLPTRNPPAVSNGTARSSQAHRTTGASGFLCLRTSLRSDGPGSRSGLSLLTFPAMALSAGAGTWTYLYRERAADGTVLRSARCVIPATAAALEFANRRLGVEPSAGLGMIRQREPRPAVMGCVADELCALEGLVVEVEPTDVAPSTETQCTAYDCPWVAPGSSGGGGVGGWGDDPLEAGPALWVVCVATGLTLLGTVILDWATIEQYQMLVADMRRKEAAYTTALREIPDLEVAHLAFDEMMEARRAVRIQAVIIAGSGLLTVAAVLGVGAACSPSVLFPTP